MEKFVILPDVTCDISPEIQRDFGLEDYVRSHFTVNDDREYATTLDWNEISREEFYKLIGDKHKKVSTAPANHEEYYAIFEKYVKEGYAVLSMSLSTRISATYNFAEMAAKRIKENYPDAKIYCFDSFRMSGGFGLLVMHALDLKQQGKSFDEIVEWLEANKRRVHQMGPVDDLIVIARRGRITMGKAILGSFAGVKPMGDCNAEGYTTVIGKAKGIKKALAATAQYVKATIVDPEDQYIIISNTDRTELAEMLKELIEKEIKVKKIYISDVYPGCAPNIGPGMCAAYYLGNEIKEDLAAEREAMANILGK